jgi:hypothetical protein
MPPAGGRRRQTVSFGTVIRGTALARRPGMSTHLAAVTGEPATTAAIGSPAFQIFATSSQFSRGKRTVRMVLIAASVLFAGACSSVQDNGGQGGAGGAIAMTGSGGSTLPTGSGGSTLPTGPGGGGGSAVPDGGGGVAGSSGPAGAGGSAVPDGGAGTGGASPDGGSCSDIQQAYAAALARAQECNLAASDACAIQVRSGFFCNCTTMVNGGADTLAAIVDQYQAAGCLTTCGGVCAQPRAFSCQADTTSSTGGRCLPTALLNLSKIDDGGSFSVPAGYEIDITLVSVGPGSYGNDVVLSSDAATVLEVTIPAGPVSFGGTTHLYRLGALSAGDVVVQIPYAGAGPDSSLPTFTVTLHID